MFLKISILTVFMIYNDKIIKIIPKIHWNYSNLMSVIIISDVTFCPFSGMAIHWPPTTMIMDPEVVYLFLLLCAHTSYHIITSKVSENNFFMSQNFYLGRDGFQRTSNFEFLTTWYSYHKLDCEANVIFFSCQDLKHYFKVFPRLLSAIFHKMVLPGQNYQFIF